MRLERLYRLGVLRSRERLPLYWWRGANDRNFGDLVGPYLARRISGRSIQYVNKHCIRMHFVTAGSILAFSNRNSVVWGSGILSVTHRIKRPREVFAVRGPASRERLISLGISCPEVFGDPALLLPRYYQPPQQKTFRVGLVPHYLDYGVVKSALCGKLDIKIIKVLDPLEKVIDDINACDRIASSSLHGLIVAQAYGIPSVWVRFSNNLPGDGIKFIDYLLSVNLPLYEPHDCIEDIRIEEIVDLIDRDHQGKIDIDLDRLLGACPFSGHENLS